MCLKSSTICVPREKLDLNRFCYERGGHLYVRGNNRNRGSASQWPTWGQLLPQMATIKTVFITHCFILFRGASRKIIASLFIGLRISSFFEDALPKASSLQKIVSTQYNAVISQYQKAV
jgi:hypothetical protein